MASGAPDWQTVITLIEPMAGVGAPDWERTVVGPGGTPIAGDVSEITDGTNVATGAVKFVGAGGTTVAVTTPGTNGVVTVTGSGSGSSSPTDFEPQDFAYQGWTANPFYTTSANLSMASGVLYLSPLKYVAGETVSDITIALASVTAGDLTADECYLGLYKFVIVGHAGLFEQVATTTAGTAEAVAAAGLNLVALSGSYTTPTDGTPLWVASLYNWTTTGPVAVAPQTNTWWGSVYPVARTEMYGPINYTAGYTTLPSSVGRSAASNAIAGAPWAGIS